MASIDLNDYFYFVHVVEKGGFTRAAEALGIPKSRLSRHIVQLEERLEATLIQRTTRQSRITELGEVFYQHARAAIDQVELAEASLKRRKNALSGTALEDRTLQEELPGYREYSSRVTYRLFPGVY